MIIEFTGRQIIKEAKGTFINSGYESIQMYYQNNTLIAKYHKDVDKSVYVFIKQYVEFFLQEYTDCFTLEMFCGKKKYFTKEQYDQYDDIEDKKKIKYRFDINGEELYSRNDNFKSHFSKLIDHIKMIKDSHPEILNYRIVVDNSSWTEEAKEKVGNRGVTNKKELNRIVEEAIEENSQVVFMGAPGTGKTYSVKKYLQDKQSAFVQFHPSYDYTDFVEGLRPVVTKQDDKAAFVRVDGLFKSFCRKIVEENLKYAYGEKWDSFKNEEKYQILDKLYESISELAKEDRLKSLDSNSIEYKFIYGKRKGYFFIDEINRADLSRVFGELMYGLEESYRGIQNRFNTQYMNLPTYDINTDGQAIVRTFDCFKKGFFIPCNIVIIGTMNDIDRSVESFDFALRRRFKWEEIEANKVMEDALNKMLDEETKNVKSVNDNGEPYDYISNICENIINMNNELSSDSRFGLTKAYHIGPAYFKNIKGSSEKEIQECLTEIFNKNIVSIIREYLRGRSENEIRDLLGKCASQLGVDLWEESDEDE